MPSQSQTRLVVLATIGAAFISSLDLFIVNVAFDDISRDFGVGRSGGPSGADLSWVLNGYAVVFAALLVPFGRLADRYGRKRMFVGGVTVFALASLACALSENVWVLVAARVVQAAGASAITPASLGLLLNALPAERRVAGVRMWAATGAIAAAIGPAIGGVLTQASWHWAFLVNLPVCALLLWLAVRHLAETPTDASVGRPDLLGSVVLTLSVALLALGLVKSPEWGWGDARTLGSLALAIVAGAWFWVRSHSHPAPVVRPGLLKVRTFGFANLTMLVFNVAFAANLLIGILWMEQVWGWSAMATGWAVAAGPIAVPITTALTHRFLPGADAGRLVAAGSIVTCVGVAWLAVTMGTDPAYVTAYLPGWFVSGIGVGLVLPNLMAGGTRDLAAHESATGSAVITMARQIGFVIGISVLFAIVGTRTGIGAVDGYRTTLWVMAAVLVVSALSALGMSARTRAVAATPVS